MEKLGPLLLHHHHHRQVFFSFLPKAAAATSCLLSSLPILEQPEALLCIASHCLVDAVRQLAVQIYRRPGGL